MPNNWSEYHPDLMKHDFEIYDNCSREMNMSAYHGHNFYEIHMVLQGTVTRYTEDNVVQLHPGDVTVFPPGVFHRCFHLEESPLEDSYARVLLYLSPEFLYGLDSDKLKLSEILNSFGMPADRCLSLPIEELKSMCRPLQEIVKANQDADPLYHLFNSAQVTMFLVQLVEKIMKSGMVVQYPEDETLIPRVLSYINTHLSDNLSLDTLAEKFFVSKFYLSHQFKQYTDLSLYQYVLTRRMMHAQILLRAGYAPSVVATACGYQEYSSFYKAFTRATGKNPRDFR